MGWVNNMAGTVLESCKEFMKEYPMTMAWRIKKHCKVISEHINSDEVVLYTFAGQKNTNWSAPFSTAVVVFTNKRMIVARSLFFGRSLYSSITPDMLNDFSIREHVIFGTVEIDTVKEHFTINCLRKKALPKIEEALSKYLLDEKLKLLKNKNS